MNPDLLVAPERPKSIIACTECGAEFAPVWPQRDCWLDAENAGWIVAHYVLDVKQTNGTTRPESPSCCPSCRATQAVSNQPEMR